MKAGRAPFGAPRGPRRQAICRLCAKVVRQRLARACRSLLFGRRLGACARPFSPVCQARSSLWAAVPDLFRPAWRSRPWCGRSRPRAASPPGYPCCFAARAASSVCLDQQPVVALFARPPVHAHQMPAALQLLAVECEVEVALWQALVRIVFRLPGAAVPDHHRAAAVLALAGWCPRICCIRSGDPRPARRAAFRPARGSGRASPPSSSSRRRARAADRNAAASRRASG